MHIHYMRIDLHLYGWGWGWTSVGTGVWVQTFCRDRWGLGWTVLGRVTGHWSLSAVMHAPFHASVLRPASQVGPMHKTAGIGKLINAVLLSLINEACVWVYAVLPSSWVNSSAPLVCRHDRVTREVGRVGLVGRDRGRRGYWVALYLYIYTAGF